MTCVNAWSPSQARVAAKAIDCVSGQVGADVLGHWRRTASLVVFYALSTHRQTDPAKLTIPIFARSLIYEMTSVQGFWLFRWFPETQRTEIVATIDRTVQLATGGALRFRRACRSRSKSSVMPCIRPSSRHGRKPPADCSTVAQSRRRTQGSTQGMRSRILPGIEPGGPLDGHGASPYVERANR